MIPTEETQPTSLGPIPASPPATPPDIEVLRRSVRRRRRFRRSVSAASLIAVIAFVVVFVSRQIRPMRSPAEVASSETADHTLEVTPSPVDSSVHDSIDAPPVNIPSTGTSPASAMDDQPRPVRVFARVRNQLPVFGYDAERKYYQHVGWIESEERIPVDLDRLSSDWQRGIHDAMEERVDPFNL